MYANQKERLRNEDPALTRVLVSTRQFNDYDAFLEWILALQNNRIVEEIECYFGLGEEINDEFVYSPLLNVIRTRSQLRKLILNVSVLRSFNISPFISAGAENPALECFHLCDRQSHFSNESIARLEAHPNLREIQFHMNPSDDHFPAKIGTLIRIIDTCPLLDHVLLQTDCQLSVDIWRPIIKVIYKRKPKLTLLLGGCPVDENGAALLHDFLQNYPNSVQLHVQYFSSRLPLSKSLSSWLPQLLGLSVHSLTLISNECKETAACTVNEIKKVMAGLNKDKTKNIKELQMVVIGDDQVYEFQAVFDDISDLLFVNKFTVCYIGERSADGNPPLKEKILDALAKNTSVEELKIEAYDENHQDIWWWTDREKERLECLLQRNVSISNFLTFPNSIPLSFLPYMFRAIQSTNARSSLIFEVLRGRVDCLFNSTSEGSRSSVKRKAESMN